MPVTRKQRYAKYAAVPLTVLLIGGLYFGACAIAEKRFSSALESASVMETEHRDGLWNYNVLSAREQSLYRLLADAMESSETKTQRTAFVPTQQEFSAAFDAVLCDYPLYCDLIREECMLVAGENSAFMRLSYLSDGDFRRQQLSDFAESIAAQAQAMTDTEFALLLHDTVVQRCSYSKDAPVLSTAYDAIDLCETDSLGYALLYTLVCREAGIDCAVVRGTVQTGEQEGSHAWNVLTLDGVTGYTDVMWDDTADKDAPLLPFHGYYFLSADEIGTDHIPMDGLDFPSEDETENYYEQRGICVNDAETLGILLPTLLTDARTRCADAVEFMLDPTFEITDYALEEALTAAIEAANADESISSPLLRAVHRMYRCTVSGGGITVQLFYEENNNELGES